MRARARAFSGLLNVLSVHFFPEISESQNPRSAFIALYHSRWAGPENPIARSRLSNSAR
jgi:hypothetical protein